MWMKHIVREDFPGISTGQHRQRADTGGSAALKHSGKPRRDLVRSDLDHNLQFFRKEVALMPFGEIV